MTLGSFGEDLGILTLGCGAENPLLHMLQVSYYLDFLGTYFIDINEVE